MRLFPQLLSIAASSVIAGFLKFIKRDLANVLQIRCEKESKKSSAQI
jgi:hypothetical protein